MSEPISGNEPKLEACDGCGEWLPLRDLKFEWSMLLCPKCLAVIQEPLPGK